MVSFQVSGQPALRFKVAARSVLFAGSRRGQVEQPVCRALVERFRRHGFGFFVGCATGVDAAFRPSWWPCGRWQLRRSVRWRPPTCSPRSTATGWCRTPSATASATTSTEGRDRSIRFELTGAAAPMRSAAMVDLLSSLPAPPPDQRSSPQPPTSCRGLWAVCQPWRQGGSHGWRALDTDSAATDEAAA